MPTSQCDDHVSALLFVVSARCRAALLSTPPHHDNPYCCIPCRFTFYPSPPQQPLLLYPLPLYPRERATPPCLKAPTLGDLYIFERALLFRTASDLLPSQSQASAQSQLQSYEAENNRRHSYNPSASTLVHRLHRLHRRYRTSTPSTFL